MVPETEAVVIGATVLIRIVVVCAGSTSPAASSAKYSRVYSPSVRTKDPPYTSHEPLSSRYEIRATPLVASEALREIVTFDRYHPLSPNDPCSPAELTGVVVSTRTLTDRSISRLPARSVARNPRTCRPSPSVTARSFATQGPPSSRYSMVPTQLGTVVAVKIGRAHV